MMDFDTMDDYLDHVGLRLEHRGFSDDQIDTYFLEHYGQKGMKWGVRRAKRASNLVKVGQGKGSKGEKFKAAMNVSAVDLVRGKGLKGAAAAKGKRIQDRTKRIKNGNAKARDLLIHYGSTRYTDLIPSRG
jgi:hypothetical protein